MVIKNTEWLGKICSQMLTLETMLNKTADNVEAKTAAMALRKLREDLAECRRRIINEHGE